MPICLKLSVKRNIAKERQDIRLYVIFAKNRLISAITSMGYLRPDFRIQRKYKMTLKPSPNSQFQSSVSINTYPKLVKHPVNPITLAYSAQRFDQIMDEAF